jgi:hypothetical protein
MKITWVFFSAFVICIYKYEGQYESNAFSFFLRKCKCSNSEIYLDDSFIFCNYEAIFPQRLYHFQQTFGNID